MSCADDCSCVYGQYSIALSRMQLLCHNQSRIFPLALDFFFPLLSSGCEWKAGECVRRIGSQVDWISIWLLPLNPGILCRLWHRKVRRVQDLQLLSANEIDEEHLGGKARGEKGIWGYIPRISWYWWKRPGHSKNQHPSLFFSHDWFIFLLKANIFATFSCFGNQFRL